MVLGVNPAKVIGGIRVIIRLTTPIIKKTMSYFFPAVINGIKAYID